MTVAQLIRSARIEAGLSQAEVAKRLGTSQPAVARLEREGANPRLETLRKVMDATGNRLSLEVAARPASSIDESLIVRNLRETPASRLAGAVDIMRFAQSARPVE